MQGQFLQPNLHNINTQLQSESRLVEQGIHQRTMSIVSGVSPQKQNNIADKVKQENLSYMNAGDNGVDDNQQQFNQLSGAQNELAAPAENQESHNNMQAVDERRNQQQEGEKEVEGLGLQTMNQNQQ